MKNIKLVIEYDGTNYYGWQKQPDGNTVQQKIEKAISAVTGETIDLIGCSRTDSGVHATGYVANFYTNSTIPGEKFFIVINQKLPNDIVVIKSEEMDEEFHARFSSTGKMYCYSILNQPIRSPLNSRYYHHIYKPLNIELMIEGSKYMIGEKDFKAFQNNGSEVNSTVRTIKDIKIEKDENYIKIYVTGDGFLYNMVRIIAGTLIDVGLGYKKPEQVLDIIESKDRSKAGKTAPALGLKLVKVFY